MFLTAAEKNPLSKQKRMLYGCVFSSVLENACFRTLHVEGDSEGYVHPYPGTPCNVVIMSKRPVLPLVLKVDC